MFKDYFVLEVDGRCFGPDKYIVRESGTEEECRAYIERREGTSANLRTAMLILVKNVSFDEE